jgi:hypothetical protein
MKIIKTEYDGWEYFSGNDKNSINVSELDHVQETQVLGPDGKPYVMKRIKNPIGFRRNNTTK